MSGLIRNLVTILMAMFRWNSLPAQSGAVAWFRVTPFDTGFMTLKSDQYFQLAESAQFDFLIKTPLLSQMLGGGLSFVNAAQMARFMRPVRLFNRVRVETRIAWADARHAWFVHSFSVGGQPSAEIVVKMKFKKGRITVPPASLVGDFPQEQPALLRCWDQALAQ